jgi:hypothetical protein
MDEPVFVIHGVGNRDQRGFAATVAALEAAAGLALHPIFWGDLGAEDAFIELALPPRGRSGLRDESGLDDAGTSEILTALLTSNTPVVPGNLPPTVRQAVRDTLSEGTGPGLRTTPHPSDTERLVLETLAAEWSATRWLSRTHDDAPLHETGAAIAEAVATETADDSDGLRGPTADAEGMRTFIRRRLADLDRVAGAALQAIAGRVNHSLRTRFGPAATRFLGDVLVYQRHRTTIQARVREHIAEVDPRWGEDESRAVRIVAHSLGGVIAVDMATADNPLWTSSLLTFGSQAAYFHLCDPRGGQLPVYTDTTPVTLPRSLAQWTNLWQPLDVLAFAVSRVFRLADGSSPSDIPLAHTAGSGLWTHSAYWDLPDLATAISTTMRQE